jgi:hypothetical protein
MHGTMNIKLLWQSDNNEAVKGILLSPHQIPQVCNFTINSDTCFMWICGISSWEGQKTDSLCEKVS